MPDPRRCPCSAHRHHCSHPDSAPTPDPRERLRGAYRDLHPASTWRGAILTALRAVDDPESRARIRALFWLHDALTMLLPLEPGADSLEQRVLRTASRAIEDELVADHAARCGSPDAVANRCPPARPGRASRSMIAAART